MRVQCARQFSQLYTRAGFVDTHGSPSFRKRDARICGLSAFGLFPLGGEEEEEGEELQLN